MPCRGGARGRRRLPRPWLTAGQRLAGIRGISAGNADRIRAVNSGDDVGGELVFDLDDAIAQMQLAFLQPLHLQQVGSGRVVQRFDGNVEIAMLLAQLPQFAPAIRFRLLASSLPPHGAPHGPRWRRSRPPAPSLRSTQTLEFPSLYGSQRHASARRDYLARPALSRHVGNYAPFLKTPSSRAGSCGLRKTGIFCDAQETDNRLAEGLVAHWASQGCSLKLA